MNTRQFISARRSWKTREDEFRGGPGRHLRILRPSGGCIRRSIAKSSIEHCRMDRRVHSRLLLCANKESGDYSHQLLRRFCRAVSLARSKKSRCRQLLSKDMGSSGAGQQRETGLLALKPNVGATEPFRVTARSQLGRSSDRPFFTWRRALRENPPDGQASLIFLDSALFPAPNLPKK
jgi:hypothetical protein